MRQNYWNSILLFLIFIFIYTLGSFTKIPFGDCMAYTLDTEKAVFVKAVSPTSHFLFVNTTILLKKITALDAIFLNRFLVITSAALVVAMIYKTVFLITKKYWISILTSFVFGFSFTFWKNTEIIEVYTFNMLWISLFLFYVIKTFLEEDKKEYHIIASGFFLSVSIWAHIENIFFIPSFILFLYYFRKQKLSIFISFLLLVLSFSIMLTFNSLQNLPPKTIFTSDQGHWVEDSFKKSLLEYIQDLIKSVVYLIYNFNVFVIFGILGAFKLFKINRKLFYVIALSATLFYGFSTFYAVSDNYVFFLPFNFIFALGIGIGLKNVRFQKTLERLSPVCLFIPLIYLCSFYVVKEIPAGQNLQNSKAYKGGLSYYILPWMNDNVGILEFTIEKRKAPEAISWMTYSAEEYIKILQKKGYTLDEIKKL